jgi:hypothetical protein
VNGPSKKTSNARTHTHTNTHNINIQTEPLTTTRSQKVCVCVCVLNKMANMSRAKHSEAKKSILFDGFFFTLFLQVFLHCKYANALWLDLCTASLENFIRTSNRN